MRWTSRAKLLFLAPAVVWVLVFTVFPLVYSLYISVYNVETKMQVKQEKVPVVDADGKQVVSANGQPETRIQVTRQNVTTYKYNGFGNYTRLFHDSNVTTAIGVTFIFVIIAVPGEIILGLVLAVLFNRGLPLRGLWRTIMAALGLIPKSAAKAVWAKGKFEVDRIDAIEREVKHDVIAFLTNLAEHGLLDPLGIRHGVEFAHRVAGRRPQTPPALALRPRPPRRTSLRRCGYVVARVNV